MNEEVYNLVNAAYLIVKEIKTIESDAAAECLRMALNKMYEDGKRND